MDRQVIEADLTLVDDRLHPTTQVLITPAGVIEAVGVLDLRPTVRLAGMALLPGMVNAHSHAFQRGLRGRAESFPDSAGTFWSWRDEMYALVERLGADEFYRICRECYAEMLRAGITTVGEFHYLHHDAGGSGYALDDAVLAAARDTGIRIVLLNTYYKTGGIGQPLETAQQRFLSQNRDVFWGQFDQLTRLTDPQTQTLGVAAHSIRAVPLDDLVDLHDEARRRDLVFHMHLEEQEREIEECRNAYGMTPLEIVIDRLALDRRFTAVHCTHSRPEYLDGLADAGANVCICPLTEGNLADGMADVEHMWSRDLSVCIGTDSNVRIGPLEELRWLEYVQRLRLRRRGVCTGPDGSVPAGLWRCATLAGARALGVPAGAIRPAHHADLIAVDLTHPALRDVPPEALLGAIVLGADSACVARVCVGGRWLAC